MTPTTTLYNFGDVLLVPFPFADDFKTTKQRPALLISSRFLDSCPYNHIILAAITSNTANLLEPFELLVSQSEAQMVGLPKDSIIRFASVFSIKRDSVIRKLGHITPSIDQKTREMLKKCFGLA